MPSRREPRPKTLMLSAATAAVLAIAGTAFAAVDFDPDFGDGFVGKGDVQNAFGWNNKTLQTNANEVGFKYVATDVYQAVCTFTNGAGNTQTPTRERTSAVEGAPDADPRQKAGQSQFTGFDLFGWLGDPTETGDPVPVVGEFCPGGPHGDGKWTSVTGPVTTGGLYVTFGGGEVLIWPPF